MPAPPPAEPDNLETLAWNESSIASTRRPT
jgi:hypothetical protein